MIQKEQILKAASLSISAHNVQPFRLAFPSQELIEIYVDSTRLLPIGDPHFKDLRQSLGAFVETLHIALSVRGFDMEAVEIHEKPSDRQPIAKLKLQSSASVDSLHSQLSERFSYRGKFAQKASISQKVVTGERFTLEFLTDTQDIKDIAKLFDDVNYQFLTLPGYIEELYSWMRFSPSHPRWATDGLNTESMSLAGVEAWGASVVLKAAVFKFLAKLGLAKALVSEAGQIQSASGLAVILSDSDKDFDKGRAFMRGWLTLTQQGLYGAPLSLLTDDKKALEVVAGKLATKGKYIVNVLRVGPLPKGYKRPASARLSWQQLEWGK
ncbi:hypothetical protein [Bdellovibrio svalbardensis]|uniref:Nitroreductase domain-containing protein n=1 Tax=Bdellovibrio svalbardensis TaxID=2972972 RepID=A0ABT6DFA5_9BACT|nr:hypothetical protein [Bdellovibrio svalbardensis]MDG0815473.1 hypothetical protein [Bdellovibrio svalbardensis]